MLKIRAESLEEDYSPRYAVIDLTSNEIYCDSDNLVDLFLLLQELVYYASMSDETVITERIVRKCKRRQRKI